jgi:hypothetical protein
MLFTTTTPSHQGDRITLYLELDEARDDARDGGTIFEVAVGLDLSGHRLTSDSAHKPSHDPLWGTPAYFEDFQRIVARGPIPDTLFTPIENIYPQEMVSMCSGYQITFNSMTF